MIYKNAKIGKLENITLIELGEGDVLVSALEDPNREYSGIGFINDVPGEVGREHPGTKGKPIDDFENCHAVIFFHNIASIEVVEEAISKAKNILLEQQS